MVEIEKLRKEDEEEIKAFARTFRVVVNSESDGDHVQSLFHDYGDLMKWYGEVVWPENDPDEDDVKTALRIAEEYLRPSVQTSISIHVGRELPEVEDDSLLRY